jgi:hypothetical protein
LRRKEFIPAEQILTSGESFMSVVPIARQPESTSATENEPSPTLRLAAGGTLLAGAVLLLTGKRKAGLALTATGTALALLHEKETTLRWWAALPIFLSNAHRIIGKAEQAMDEVNARKDKLRSMFKK